MDKFKHHFVILFIGVEVFAEYLLSICGMLGPLGLNGAVGGLKA